MSLRRNPFDEMERLFDRLIRQFEEASRSWDEETLAPWVAGEFAVDVLDGDDELVVTVDVPGFDRDEIDVRVADHTLWIEAEREESAEAEDETYLRQERRRRSRRRSLELPTTVDTDDVTATLKNGILTVRIPKAEPGGAARHIEIES